MKKIIATFASLSIVLVPFTVWFAISEYLRISYLLIAIVFFLDIIYSYFNKNNRLIVRQANTDLQRFYMKGFLLVVVISFVINFFVNFQPKLLSNFFATVAIIFLLYYYYSSLLEKYLSFSVCIKYMAISCVLLMSVIILDSLLVNFAHIKIHDMFCFGYKGNADYFERYIWTSTAAPTEEPGASAQFLCALFPFALYYFKGKRLWIIIGYVLCLAFLFSTTGIMILAICSVLYVLLYSRRRIKILFSTFLAFAVVFTTSLYATNDDFKLYVDQLGIVSKVTFSGKSESDSDRSEGMTLALKDAFDAPVIGKGPGYGKAIRETGYLSTFLGFMGCYGITGGCLFILFWITFYMKIFKLRGMMQKVFLFSFVSITISAFIGDTLHMFLLWFLLPIINKAFNEQIEGNEIFLFS